jgi:Mrp family chromosome partitioning ATPase
MMRRTARRCASRLRSSNTPVFGAVLNDMSANSSGEYYVEYHSKLVKEYYNPAAEGVGAAKRANE